MALLRNGVSIEEVAQAFREAEIPFDVESFAEAVSVSDYNYRTLVNSLKSGKSPEVD